MESLCIVAEESVWCVRLDIHVLNHGGNVADIAGIAGLAALSHFRRPDANVTDGKVGLILLPSLYDLQTLLDDLH